MYGWIVNRLRNAEAEHTKNGEDKLAVLCRDAASVVAELNTRNKTLRELLHESDTTIDSLTVSLETYRGLTEAMQHNQQAQWIPVTEALPESVDDDVLVTDGESCAVGYWRPDAQAWDSTDFGWLENRSEPPCGIHTVTHWMPLPPLPEPPKEET